MIIDFHTHIFPPKIARMALDKLEDNMESVQGAKLVKRNTDGTVTGLLAEMEKSDVDISVVMPIATKPSQFKSITEYAKEVSLIKNIFSFGSIHPDGNYKEELKILKEENFIGIKLHPEFQNFYIDDEVVTDIVNLAKELNLYVLFHCGADYGYRPPFKCTPKRLKTLIQKTGGENIICAHFGGFLMWDEVLELIAGTPVFLDTSLTSGIIDIETMRKIIDKHGADRILFGSDSPWQSQKKAFEIINRLELKKDDYDKISHKNAMKILGI